MTRIKFDEQTFVTENNETVLDTLLRNNVQVPYGCKSGACQSCLMRSLDNVPPLSSQAGLKDTQQKQKYFLSCICHPDADMSVSLPDAENSWCNGEVIEKSALSSNVLLLKLKSEEPFAFFAGQFVNLKREDGLIRSYSIANTPNASHELEFHIRVLPTGQFSRWVADELAVGMALSFSHALGNCHYVEGNAEQPLLMIGTGTGLAPLYGILRDALENHHHTGEIHLFHGSRDATGLYLENELTHLAEKHPNFNYVACLSGDEAPENYAKGRANEVAFGQFPKLNGWRVYLCGQPEMVLHAKRTAYLKGASLTQIYADPFSS